MQRRVAVCKIGTPTRIRICTMRIHLFIKPLLAVRRKMKLKNTIKILSIFLAVIIALVTLPLSVLAITSEEYVMGNNEETPNNIKPETNVGEVLTELNTEETEYELDFLELETEICDDEFEEDDLGLSAPPLEDIGQTLDPNAVPVGIIDGVYEIENIGNPDFYIAVEGNYAVEGYRLLQKAYSGSTPLTNFTRSSLFKISKAPGATDRYIIRSMLNNRLSIGVQGSKLVTTIIEADDSLVPASSTFTITFESGGFVIKPYGSSTVVAAPNSNASGDAGVPNSYISVSFASSAGTRGKWSLTRYSGEAKSGFTATRTASMGDGLVKGTSGNLWVKSWSTVIGANTVYVSVTSATSNMVSSVWNDTAGRATITGLKCGDFKMKAEIYVGSSNTAAYAGTYSYTVIPDIVGDTAFVQNAATGKYMEVESASTSNGGIVQQWSFHTQSQMNWIFELGGGGYFKIKCVNSSKYLGVDSSDTSKVKQYSTVTDYTLWKLVETSNGVYKISCKASALSGKVLTTPASTSGNGVDLTMLSYVSDSDYKDEWKIIAFPMDVSLIALPETYDRSSYFSDILDSLKNIEYDRSYDNHIIVNSINDSQIVMTKTELLQYMESSKITLIRTHGNRTGIRAGDALLTTTDLSALSSNYFDFSELIIYGACSTASGGINDSGNFVNMTISKGARTVIGFEDSVYAGGCNQWCQTFFEYYTAYYNVDGKTIEDVCIATDLIMQSHRLYSNTDGTITLANYVVAGEITYP